MKQILVTGGFGFIGGHLITELLKQGHHVHVVDDLSTSPVPLPVLLEELPAGSISYDLCTIQDYCRQFPHEHFDEIYHLASPVGPAGVLKWAGKLAIQVMRDIELLMEVAQRSNARLLDVSTSEIYGGGKGGKCAEDFDRLVPAKTTVRLEYAVGKLAAETALINAHNVNGLDCVIVRPFNVAGPRQAPDGGFVVPRFIKQLMNDEPLTIFGDGNQVRAFTHVSDIATGLIAVMECGASGEAYNIGNPSNKVTINQLAAIVMSLSTDKKIAPVYVDPRKIFGEHYAEAADKFPDAEKAMTELNWQPQHNVLTTVTDAYLYEMQKVKQL